MGKIIFCVIIGGLCFGQGIWLKEKPKIPLPFPMGVSIKSPYPGTESWIRRHSFYSSNSILPASNIQLFLFSQASGESLQSRTPFWKQAGIYGLEFVGGEVATLPTVLIVLKLLSKDYNWDYLPVILTLYFGSNSIGTSTAVWITGKLLNQKGTWWKACVGSTVGVTISTLMVVKLGGTKADIICLPAALFAPPLGGVIGYNF